MLGEELKWARRVPQGVIERLYTLDAKGIVDEELIDEVGYALYARCESIRIVTEAQSGRVTCPRCRSVVQRALMRDRASKEERIECACGWSGTWGEYLKSYQRKQLFGGAAYPFFLEFLARWPRQKTPRDKLLAVDKLIHSCHVAAKMPWARPAATNLIEGSASELAAFLDKLAYGPKSTPGREETRVAWQRLRSERFFPGAKR
ncbi:MAG: hypothetical protein WEB04_01365 [Dehalococcoidia bacterium]